MIGRNWGTYLAALAAVLALLFLAYVGGLFGGGDLEPPTTAPPAASAGTTR